MERHSPASPLTVGVELAAAVQRLASDQSLGYFPALDFFRDQDALDGDLLDAFDSLTWLGEQLINSELQTRLRSVFLRHEVGDIRHHAHALPPVKPQAPNAGDHLAMHYTPNRFKIDISGVLTPRLQHADIEPAILFALRDSFQRLECVHCERRT